jgi:hypothetical protein
MNTPDLIRSLAGNVAPVKRLRSPWLRAGLWLLVATAITVVLTLTKGPRPQFFERMRDVTFAVGMLASLLTGVLAAIATFMLSLPDRSRAWIWLPVPPLLVWLSQIGYQCFAGWVALPPGAVTVEGASSCLGTMALTSLPLTLLLAYMLRYAALLRPMSVVLVGALAVSAMTCNALAMFHPLDPTVMVLGWNLGTGVLFMAVAALFGRRLSKRKPRTEDLK